MKGVRIAKEAKIGSHSTGNTNINVEFNMPVSMVNIRCEKENFVTWMDSKVILSNLI
jgi:hypothetical protein